MTLYQKLQEATSKEDVKDGYIKALSLKSYSKNLIDIQTKEIWFEVKDTANILPMPCLPSCCIMCNRLWTKAKPFHRF